MRLTVKQNESTISEFQFGKGPIYIGRHANSQIYLGHRAVSRQHAVIFNTQDGTWVVEDLDSTNKTYLNDESVHKAAIKTGDVLRIVYFTIEIDLEDDTKAGKRIDMEDTLTRTAYNLEASLEPPADDVIIRKPEAARAPVMRLPARRLTEFSQASEAICEAENLDGLILKLLGVVLRQLGANRAWCALRKRSYGPMTSHAGRQRNGRGVTLSDLKLSERINQAVENGQHIVLPRVSAQMEEEDKIGSVLISPIVGPSGCLGVIYVDNDVEQEHYGLSDLDYLMLIAHHTAAVVENF